VRTLPCTSRVEGRGWDLRAATFGKPLGPELERDEERWGWRKLELETQWPKMEIERPIADGYHKRRASVVFAIQNWLGESEEAKKTSSQPAYFSVGMSSTYLSPFLNLLSVP
jgi:hypothetical protein